MEESCEKYICQFCGKEYSRACNLQAHENHYCDKNPNKKEISKDRNTTWKCQECGEVFKTRQELYSHKKETGHINVDANKKELKTCPFCNKTWETSKRGYTVHKKYCHSNPNRSELPKKTVKEDVKKRISESMKEKFKKGEIKRWNSPRNKHSYPESWFMKAIKNEFGLEEKKDYVCELSFDRYFLDFAFLDRKLCVEIDGAQHEEKRQKESDERKDLLLKENGWTEIRADWSFIYNNPKEFLKNFFEIYNSLSSENVNINKYSFKGHRVRKRDLERNKRLEDAKENGTLGKNGNLTTRLSNSEIERRKKLILESGVDLMKYGWKAEVSKKTGLTRRQIEKSINRMNLNYFKRKC